MTWSPTICIDRCVCQRMLFSQLQPLAESGGWDLQQIVEETGCGDQCGMCVPYLREMLATGTVEFDRIIRDAACEHEAA